MLNRALADFFFLEFCNLRVLPEAKEQQLYLILTEPPRPQLDRSHRQRMAGWWAAKEVWSGLGEFGLFWGRHKDLKAK